MGAGFYPRLSGVASDNAECSRLVNEQALIGLLIAGPGVPATLTLVPLVIALFYNTKFKGAVPVLRDLAPEIVHLQRFGRGVVMGSSKRTEAQIIAAAKQAEAGRTVEDMARGITG